MSSTKLIVNSDHALQEAIGQLRESYQARRYVTVTINDGKPRSLDQNAISHAWYEQVARELREDTTLGVKSFCKLHFGVPILRVEEEDYRATYDRIVKPMAYEDKLALMSFYPVTSLMKTPQLSQYLEAVQAHYQRHGVWLQFPEQAPTTKQQRAA